MADSTMLSGAHVTECKTVGWLMSTGRAGYESS